MMKHMIAMAPPVFMKRFSKSVLQKLTPGGRRRRSSVAPSSKRKTSRRNADAGAGADAETSSIFFEADATMQTCDAVPGELFSADIDAVIKDDQSSASSGTTTPNEEEQSLSGREDDDVPPLRSEQVRPARRESRVRFSEVSIREYEVLRLLDSSEEPEDSEDNFSVSECDSDLMPISRGTTLDWQYRDTDRPLSINQYETHHRQGKGIRTRTRSKLPDDFEERYRKLVMKRSLPPSALDKFNVDSDDESLNDLFAGGKKKKTTKKGRGGRRPGSNGGSNKFNMFRKLQQHTQLDQHRRRSRGGNCGKSSSSCRLDPERLFANRSCEF